MTIFSAPFFLHNDLSFTKYLFLNELKLIIYRLIFFSFYAFINFKDTIRYCNNYLKADK
jgi:hypothetical protein